MLTTISTDEEKILLKLNLASKRHAQIVMHGVHSVSKRGSNVEFREHKQYTTGDELKHFDWKVFARTDREYIKTFEEEQAIVSYVCFDISSSIFRSINNDDSKIKLYNKAALYLSYFLRFRKEPTGFCFFSDTVKEFQKPVLNFQVPQLIRTIYDYNNNHNNRKTDYKKFISQIINKVTRSSIVFILSDFYEDPLTIIDLLKPLTYKKCDIYLLHCIDNDEYNYNTSSDIHYIDSETTRKEYFNSAVFRNEYRKLFEKHINDFKRYSQQSNIRYTPLFSMPDILTQFVKVFN